MCVIKVDITSDKDIYFVISNTILSIDKPTFTTHDVIDRLRKNNVRVENVSTYVNKTIDNLVEHGMVIEEPRSFKIASL